MIYHKYDPKEGWSVFSVDLRTDFLNSLRNDVGIHEKFHPQPPNPMGIPSLAPKIIHQKHLFKAALPHLQQQHPIFRLVSTPFPFCIIKQPRRKKIRQLSTKPTENLIIISASSQLPGSVPQKYSFGQLSGSSPWSCNTEPNLIFGVHGRRFDVG